MTAILLICAVASAAGLFYLTGLYTAWYWYFIPLLMVPVLYLVWFGLLILLCGLIALFSVNKKKQVARPRPFFYHVTVSTLKQLVFLSRTKVEVRGMEKLPEGSYLAVYNHRSDFDPIILGAKLPTRRVVMISKPENEKMPIVGRYMHAAGYLTINRTSPRAALKTVDVCAAWIKEGIASAAIAPEGTRSRTGELLPFRAAPFSIARKAECPIVVVAFTGTEQIHKNFPLHRTHVVMNICQVIPPEDYSELSSVNLAESVRELMLSALPSAPQT